jgi:pimeloyl-ACP methyl ester carboxylesterase
LWVPVKVQLGVRKVNLEVGLDPEDEENMEKSIIADGMLKNVGPVDISKRLFKKLRECENARTGKLRVHDYGYDWRLSPHLLSRKLVEFLEKLPSNQRGVPKEQRGALVIAHSLGGVITRHAVNQRPELFSGVLYAGVPQRCINILGPLRNGDAVLLNEKILTAQVHFSLRTSFVFLPEDGFCFVDKVTKEEYNIDFYNVEDWIKYRICPAVSEPALPALSRSSTFGSLLSLSDSLPSLPLRSRSSTQSKKNHPGSELIKDAILKDRTLAPQLNS